MRLPLLVAACLLAFAGVAHAGTRVSTTSTNWSGYTVAGTGQSYSDVKGSWVEPAVACPARGRRYSAFWVGLGGSGSADGLEQIGTEADCVDGVAHYTAWYELIPAGTVTLPVTVTPGDAIDAEVAVAGDAVTLSVSDATNGGTYSATLTLAANLDVSSAEWIAEAPSECQGEALDTCAPLGLANFGTVAFTDASATANAHTGAIADDAWSPVAIALRGLLGANSAVAGPLGADGASFSVAATAPPRPRKRR